MAKKIAILYLLNEESFNQNFKISIKDKYLGRITRFNKVDVTQPNKFIKINIWTQNYLNTNKFLSIMIVVVAMMIIIMMMTSFISDEKYSFDDDETATSMKNIVALVLIRMMMTLCD